MRKSILWMYVVAVALVVLFTTYIMCFQNNARVNSRYERNCTKIEYYSREDVEDDTTPCGIKYVYKWKIEDVTDLGAAYTFYSVHHNVYYYIDDELIGSLETNPDNLFGKTTYSDWATAFVSSKDNGKMLRVEVIPLYDFGVSAPDSFYFGDYNSICVQVINENMVVFIIGLILVIVGAGFVVFGISTRKNPEADRGVLCLGVFSMCAGLWKLTDMRAAPLVFGHAQGLGYLSIVILSLIVIPYSHFISVQFKHKKDKVWNSLGLLSVIQTFAVIILQAFNVIDVRQSLIATHAVIIICIIVVICMIFLESRYARWSKKLTVTIICSLLCLIGASVDLIIYYIHGDSGTVIFCIIAFLIYVVSMGYLSIRETKVLMDLGREAKHYEHIAMHDSLTGLFSRSFYNEYLSRHEFENTDCSIILFDMNHLKKSNDTYGHEFGDKRLRDFGGILKEVFCDVGKVCRFGGDEFCVLIRQSYTKEWMAYLNIYEDKMEEYNRHSDASIPLSAAYGYATFDPKEDEDFASTIRRADKMMYQMKVIMKMERKEEE